MVATEINEYVCEKLVTTVHVAYTEIGLNIGKNNFDIHAELFTS